MADRKGCCVGAGISSTINREEMGNPQAKNLRPKLTISYNGRNIDVLGREPSFQLRKELRAIQGLENQELIGSLRKLPEELANTDNRKQAEYLRSLPEDELTKVFESTTEAENISDEITLRLCHAAIDKKKLNPEHPLFEEIVADPIDENGEPTELWASQNWEEVVEFVDRFRSKL